MRKYLYIMLGCLFAAFLLYSPWTLALKPGGEDIIRSGMSVVLGVVLFVVFIVCLVRYISTGKEMPRILSIEDKELKYSLIKMENRLIVRQYANSAFKQLGQAENQIESLRQILGKRFGRTSITFSRYDSTVSEARIRMIGNIETLCLRMQEFNEKEYADLASRIASGEYRKDPVEDRLQEDKFLDLHARLDVMKEILDSNEGLLLNLAKCAEELVKIGDNEKDKKNEELMLEIKNLVETTKYYS